MEIIMICTAVWPSHTGSAVIVHRPSDRPRKRHLGPEHVSRAWAERKTERSGRKTAWAGVERWAGVEKNHLSGSGAERAKSAAQSPLTPTLRWLSDIRCMHSIILLTFSTYFQNKINNILVCSLVDDVTDRHLLKSFDENVNIFKHHVRQWLILTTSILLLLFIICCE